MGEQANLEDEPNRPAESRQNGEPGLIRALWVFFGSMKTAILLLLILAVASIIGTVVPQGGAPEQYLQQYGPAKAAVIIGLSLHDVFHSAWYSALLTFISINLLVCNVNRFKVSWERFFRPTVTATVAQIENMQMSERVVFRGPADDARDRSASVLQSSGYSVRSAGDCVHGAKGRIAIWGPYLTHLSLLVIFAGYMLGNRLGFDGYAFIPEGSQVSAFFPKDSQEVRQLCFDVKLIDFEIELENGRSPSAYRSRLQIYENGTRVAEKTIDVNHPLTYRGITFYQSDFGVDRLVLKVTRPDGTSDRITVRMETASGPHGKQFVPELVPVAFMTGGEKWSFFVHDFAPDYVGPPRISASSLPVNPAAQVYVNENFEENRGGWKEIGWISNDESGQYKGHRIELERVVDYTGLQVASNPMLPIVYAGFGLILLGITVSFYVRRRVIRVLVSSGLTVHIGGSSHTGSVALERDIARLKDALK